MPGQTLLWKCPACDLYQQGQLPDDEAYENAYHEDYQRALSRKIRTAQVRLCRVSKFLQSSAPDLLDIGCSVGATVTAAERRGWSAKGVDVSQTAVDVCRRQGLDCRRYDGQQLPFDDESFDVLTSWHVIEHVPDVTQTLAEWLRVLRPGGVLILETPHARCWKARFMGHRYRKFWPAEHLYTFTPKNLPPFVRRAQFELLATPLVVAPTNVGLTTSAFAVAHQSYLAASRLTGFCKSFQIVARRPNHDPVRSCTARPQGRVRKDL